MRLKFLCGVCFFALVLASCERSPSTAPTDGVWRAVLTLPGGELPFTVEVENLASGSPVMTIRNGEERVPVPQVTLDGDRLTMNFMAFNNKMVVERNGAGYDGELTLIKRGGVPQSMRLSLQPSAQHRFFAKAQDVNADFGGTWRVAFLDDDGNTMPAVGEFVQQNGRVTGTFRTPTGDYRYLAGAVRDRSLYLSTFDGAHAFLFVATQAKDGTLNGDFWSGTQWHESFTAQRDANASLPDPLAMSTLNDDVGELDFAYPNTAGDVVSLSDPRFAGKVTIIALAGSWCPNCHDEAAFLAPFYARKRAQGLEVMGLMFEHLEDFKQAATQVDLFRDKFAIEYELLVAGFSDKQRATETLGWLSEVIAYPTMVVLDRAGNVRRVHTGFEGPGTGVHYTQFSNEFEQFIDQLLAEGES